MPLINKRDDLVDWVATRLGAPKVNVELAPEQVDSIIDEAIQYFNKFAENTGNQEGFLLVNLISGQNEYILPDNILQLKTISVKKTYSTWMAYSLIQGLMRGYSNFDFITIEAMQIWIDTLKHIIPSKYRFYFSSEEHKLTVVPIPKENETILIGVVKAVDELFLLNHVWVKNYVLAKSKQLLGVIRNKYKSLPGYDGQVQLNGDDLITQAKEEIEKLENELKKFKYSRPPFGHFG